MRWLPSSRVASAPAGATDDSEPLTAAQIAAWRSSGVVVLRPGLLPLTLLADVRRDALRSFGAPGRADDALAFPSTASTAANVVTLHPRLLRAAAQLLGVPTLSLRLTQSHVWAKHGEDPPNPDADQRIHMDWPNNSLICPAPLADDGGCGGDAVALHVYLDDVSDCGGPTVFVPAESCGDPAYALPAMSMMPGVAGHPRNQSRQRAEEYFSSAASLADAAELRRTLYARESGVRFELGTVALYQLNVWHRGTPVTTVRQQLSQTLRDGGALCTRLCFATQWPIGSSAAPVRNETIGFMATSYMNFQDSSAV